VRREEAGLSGGDWKDMFHAALRGDTELVGFHLDSGIDVDHSHPEYLETVLVAAILARQEEMAHFLLDLGADPHLISVMDALTPLQAARQVGLASVVARLAPT